MTSQYLIRVKRTENVGLWLERNSKHGFLSKNIPKDQKLVFQLWHELNIAFLESQIEFQIYSTVYVAESLLGVSHHWINVFLFSRKLPLQAFLGDSRIPADEGGGPPYGDSASTCFPSLAQRPGV